ncbi:hypothetical protein CEB3_c18990 [Peptococcaceae bacterium CEB3]|nr:hypothetical protein CEB3_c18990 [Peptococcaceae bacterium CEB3]
MKYTIYMTHKMRSVQFVEAENEEDAKELAYAQAFDEDGSGSWEEIDTKVEEIKIIE